MNVGVPFSAHYELAAAADLLMGKAENIPVVVIRGYRYKPASENATSIIRPVAEDLFAERSSLSVFSVTAVLNSFSSDQRPLSCL